MDKNHIYKSDYEKYYAKKNNIYKDLILESNKIDTLILSGGAYAVFYYIGMVKYLREIDEIKNIKHIYAISAGNVIALCIMLNFTIDEIIELINYDYVKTILNIDTNLIFNIFDNFGLNDGNDGNNVTKYILEKKNINPFITLKELYLKTGINLYIGVCSVFKYRYINLSHINYPNMPVWLAIRASCGLPIILYPINYYEINDYLVDGGLMNNNPVGVFLEEYYNKKKNIDSNPIQDFKNFIYSQSKHKINNSAKIIQRFIQKNNIIQKKSKKKYVRNFISIEYKNYDESSYENFDINKITLGSFLGQLATIFFYNQHSFRNDFKTYVYFVELHKCKYNLSPYVYEFNKINFEEILKFTYEHFKLYFEKYVKIN